jgi:hypothetical protein
MFRFFPLTARLLVPSNTADDAASNNAASRAARDVKQQRITNENISSSRLSTVN